MRESFNTSPYMAMQFLVILLSTSFALIFALSVGFRDESMGTDTNVYIAIYELVKQCHCHNGAIEIGFNKLMLALATLGLSTPQFLAVISAIQITLTVYVASRMASYLAYSQNKMFKWIAICFILMLLSPFFMGAQINVLRQSISAIFVLLAALSILQGRYYQAVLWVGLAVSFHTSAVIFLVFLAGLFLSFNLIIGLSLSLFFLYISGSTELLIELVSSITGLSIYQAISGYRADVEYKSGVRIKFALFSIAPLLLYFIAQYLDVTHKQQWLARLKAPLKIYLLLLIPFWLFGWANFSDRLAWSAWFAMPLFLTPLLFPILHRFSLPILFLGVVLAGSLFIVRII
jgi:hypothetical protein